MDKYKAYLLLFSFAVAFIVYVAVLPYISHGEHSKALEELVKSLEKGKHLYNNGAFLHKEEIVKGEKEVEQFLYIERHGEDFKVVLNKTHVSWEIGRVGEKRWVCYSFFDKRKCSHNLNRTEIIFSSLSKASLGEDWVEKNFIKNLEILEKNHAIKSIEEKEKEGCKEFILNYSYSKLPPSDLEEIGIPVSSVLVYPDSYIRDRICVDEKGLIKYRIREYFTPGYGKEAFYLLERKNISNISLESQEDGEQEIIDLYTSSLNFLKDYLRCEEKEGEEKDICLRTVAINYRVPQLCKETGNISLCIEGYLVFTNDKTACDILENQSFPICSGGEKNESIS